MIEPERLERMRCVRRILEARVVGQGKVLSEVVDVSCAWLAGVREIAPRLLFVGPSGVGKTECARALGEALYGREPFRLDMSEFQRQESLEWILGNREGDCGRLKRLDESGLLLLDEVEKAHPLVLDLLLQMLEPGILTRADGVEINLRNVCIVCTSNVATANLVDAHGLSTEALSEFVAKELEKPIRIEILNRFDGIELFSALDFDAQVIVLRRHLREYLQWLAARGYSLDAEEAVEGFLLMRGFDERWGARPLRRAIRRYVGNAIVRDLQRGGKGCGKLALGEEELGIE